MARPKAGALDDKKRQYGMWLGLPKETRKDDERTEEQFAKKLEVAYLTLSRWKKDALVKEVAESAVKQFGGNDKMAIVNALIKEAKGGNVQAIRAYLEWQGEIGTTGKKDNSPREINVTLKRQT